MPVNWRASVVVPVSCGATSPPRVLPVNEGTSGVLRVGEGELRCCDGSRSYGGAISERGDDGCVRGLPDTRGTRHRRPYRSSPRYPTFCHSPDGPLPFGDPSLQVRRRSSMTRAIESPADPARLHAPSAKQPYGTQGRLMSYRTAAEGT